MNEIEKVFHELEELDLIKGHHGHKKGEVMLVSCARCTYEEIKAKLCATPPQPDESMRGKIQDILVGFKYGNLNSVPLLNRLSGVKEVDQITALYAGYLKPDEVAEKVKAERERIYAWGLEKCVEHGTAHPVVFKSDCPKCWQALREE